MFDMNPVDMSHGAYSGGQVNGFNVMMLQQFEDEMRKVEEEKEREKRKIESTEGIRL